MQECCVAAAQDNRNESNAHQYSHRSNCVAHINNESCTNHIFCEFVRNRNNCGWHITQDPQGRDPIYIRMFTKAHNSLNETMVFVTITIFANLNGNAKQCFTDAQPLKTNHEYISVPTKVEALLYNIQELITITVALNLY